MNYKQNPGIFNSKEAKTLKNFTNTNIKAGLIKEPVKQNAFDDRVKMFSGNQPTVQNKPSPPVTQSKPINNKPQSHQKFVPPVNQHSYQNSQNKITEKQPDPQTKPVPQNQPYFASSVQKKIDEDENKLWGSLLGSGLCSSDEIRSLQKHANK